MKLSLCMLILAITSNGAGVFFNRTVSTQGATGFLKLQPNNFCKIHDKWGDNDCSIPWSTDLHFDFEATLENPLTQKSFITIDAKFEKILPLNIHCAICGVNCSFVIPVIKQPATIVMPDCPIKSPFVLKGEIPLPATSPLGPIGVPITAVASITDDTGKVITKINVDAKLD